MCRWEGISSYGQSYQNQGNIFSGPLDEYPRDKSTNTSSQAWDQLNCAKGQDSAYSLELKSGSM